MLRPARPRRPDRADRYDTKKTTMHHDAPADAIQTQGVRGAQVLILCAALEPNLAFWTERLGFRIEAIFPADDPTTAMISGHGLQLRLQQGPDGAVQTIYLLCDDALLTGAGQTTLTAPSGVVVKLVDANPPMHTPTTVQKLVLTRATGNDTWGLGRAGLRYRDLLPGRHGGAFIASHIRVLDGGPVPDYVHFHKIRFQTIFCRKGWVRVLYQGQGESFVMHEGDCVLQPPMIRHRVLESSAGAEVVEVSAPAEHITMADHDLALPGPHLPPDHDFAGQRFVGRDRHGLRFARRRRHVHGDGLGHSGARRRLDRDGRLYRGQRLGGDRARPAHHSQQPGGNGDGLLHAGFRLGQPRLGRPRAVARPPLAFPRRLHRFDRRSLLRLRRQFARDWLRFVRFRSLH